MNRKRMVIILFVSVVAVIAIAALVYVLLQSRRSTTPTITNFAECETAGFDIMESYPRQCRDDEGNLFVEEIDNEFPENEMQPNEQREGDVSDSDSDYYGSSTNYSCEKDSQCRVSGCNGEICGGVDEEELASICLYPDEPLPPALGYRCGCFANQCQWSK